MWMWPSKHLLKMHTEGFGFGHLTKCRWTFHEGNKTGTSDIWGPPLVQICHQEMEEHDSLSSLPDAYCYWETAFSLLSF